MKILRLTLKKKWFDLILSGEKLEDYRTDKPFWASRLCDKNGQAKKDFDLVECKNGYGKNVPTIYREFKEITMAELHPPKHGEEKLGFKATDFAIVMGEKVDYVEPKKEDELLNFGGF